MISYWRWIISDNEFKKKICITFAVFFSYLLQGWSEEQIGVALPSLESLIAVDSELFSLTIVIWNIGCITGSLTSGVLYDKFNRLKLMAIFTLGLAVGTLLLPHCRTLLTMLVCRFFLGAFTSACDTGANTIIPTVWQDKCGPFIQLLYVCYAAGGIISPFATVPFVSVPNNVNETTVRTAVISESTKDNNNNNSEIGYAFMITAVLYLICAIPYVVMQWLGGFDILTTKYNETYELFTDDSQTDNELPECTENSERDDSLDSRRAAVIIVLLCGIHAIFIAVEQSLVVYLVTFCLEYLHWNDVISAELASAYWISSCVTGLFGLVIVAFMSSSKILWFSLIITNISFCFVITGCLVGHSWLVWAGILSSGFSMIMVVPTLFTWSQKYVCEISGKISSLFIVTAGLCASLSAYLVSYMMSHYSKISYIYIMLVGTGLCLVFYIVAFFVRFGCGRQTTN